MLSLGVSPQQGETKRRDDVEPIQGGLGSCLVHILSQSVQEWFQFLLNSHSSTHRQSPQLQEEQEEKKDDEESEDERQTPENNSTVAAVLNSIDQDFGDLACDHDFDETDMKGDKQAIKDAKEEKKASKAASSSDQPASKKRKADKIAQDILKKADELENKADGKIGEEKGANAENQPEKKKKKARRGKKGLGKVKQLHTVPLSSSVDWAKCTNEFDC